MTNSTETQNNIAFEAWYVKNQKGHLLSKYKYGNYKVPSTAYDWELWQSAVASVTPEPAFKKGTSLSTIILDGIARDFETSQIIAEAQAAGFVIDESVVATMRKSFETEMEAKLDEKPTAYARKWLVENIVPVKGMEGYKLLPVTKVKCLASDYPLYLKIKTRVEQKVQEVDFPETSQSTSAEITPDYWISSQHGDLLASFEEPQDPAYKWVPVVALSKLLVLADEYQYAFGLVESVVKVIDTALNGTSRVKESSLLELASQMDAVERDSSKGLIAQLLNAGEMHSQKAIQTTPLVPLPAEEILSIELQSVESQNEHGFWRACSGCYESNEGAPPTGAVFSKVFKCYLGDGCGDCGGMGAIWDTTDYDAMAIDMSKTMFEEHAQQAESPLLIQSGKYDIENARLVNAETRKPIPSNEPVFILRGNDVNARETIQFYRNQCADAIQKTAVGAQLTAFVNYFNNMSHLMKEPNTCQRDASDA